MTIRKFKTVTPTERKWINPVSGVKYSIYEVELECGHKCEIKSTGWLSGLAECNICSGKKKTHYIKFHYTKWDVVKSKTRRGFKKAYKIVKSNLSFCYFYVRLGLGYLGFLGSDPKFFPNGGLIQRFGRFLTGKKAKYE